MSSCVAADTISAVAAQIPRCGLGRVDTGSFMEFVLSDRQDIPLGKPTTFTLSAICTQGARVDMSMFAMAYICGWFAQCRNASQVTSEVLCTNFSEVSCASKASPPPTWPSYSFALDIGQLDLWLSV